MLIQGTADPTQIKRTFRIIAFSQPFGQLLFALTLLFVAGSEPPSIVLEPGSTYPYLAAGFSAIMTTLALLVFGKGKEIAKSKSTPEERLTIYRTRFIVGNVMINAAAMLNLVGYLVTQESIFVAIFAFVFAVEVFYAANASRSSELDALMTEEIR